MPNWCWNELTIQGETADLQEFVKKNTGLDACYAGGEQDTQEYFCFNAMVPVPEEILQKGYGDAGYHWQCKNWGVKWDILLDPENMIDSIVNGELSINFETAWNPPLEWLGAICPQFPKLTFHLYYEEPGNWFAGEWEYRDNQISKTEYKEEKLQEIFAEYLEDDD